MVLLLVHLFMIICLLSRTVKVKIIDCVVRNLILILFLTSFYTYSNNPHKMTLIQPPKSQAGLYIKELLKRLYSELGKNVEFIEVPGARELQMVEQGLLVGALARQAGIEEKHPTLIRIPLPILTFELVQVSNEKQCGMCKLESLKSISYTRGAVIAENYLKQLSMPIKQFPIKNSHSLNNLLLKGRVDSVLMMDFEMTDEIKFKDHFIKRSIEQKVNYHYLSPKYKHLKQPLLKALAKLKKDGVIEQLKYKYRINMKRLR